MVEEVGGEQLILIRSEQLDLLRVNDGWGDFLSLGSGREAGLEKVAAFYSFLDDFYPGGEGGGREEAEKAEVVVLWRDGKPALEGRGDVLALPAETLEDQFGRFCLLELVDSEWRKRPEVSSVFAVYQGLIPGRVDELRGAARSFHPAVPTERTEAASLWTTVLFLKGLVRMPCGGEGEKKIKTGMLRELLSAELFTLNKGKDGVVLEIVAERKEGGWAEDRRSDTCLLFFLQDLAQPGGIGRCCFTVKTCSRGLEAERRSRAVDRRGEPAERTVMETAEVAIAKIIYDEYPMSGFSVYTVVKEFDVVGEKPPGVKAFSEIRVDQRVRNRKQNNSEKGK